MIERDQERHITRDDLRQNAPAPDFLDLDLLPLPSRRNLDPRYGEVGTESIQTKRGCPLQCLYCTYPAIEGRRHRRIGFRSSVKSVTR